MTEKKKTETEKPRRGRPRKNVAPESAFYCQLSTEAQSLLTKLARKRVASKRAILEAAIRSYASGADLDAEPLTSPEAKLAAIRRIVLEGSSEE